MPRVTEVLGYLTVPELVSWIENNSKAKRKGITGEALRIGSAVDLLVQEDIRDGGYLVPEGDLPIIKCMSAWELFKKDYTQFIPSVVSMQTELTQDEIVGHPDFIHANGITDLKCATGIRPKYWTQCAKYLDMVGYKVGDFIAVLRLDKVSGLYEYKVISDKEYILYEVSVFEAYYTAWNHAFKNREQLRVQLESESLI